MRTIYSADQLLHRPQSEFHRGELVPHFECPERASSVLEALQEADLGPIDPPATFADDDHLLRVHSPGLVEFLHTAHDQWRASGRDGDAVGSAWPVRGARTDRVPTGIDGKLSFYSFDMATPITAHSWQATKAASDIATTGARLLAAGDEQLVFGLCRPPGHHSSRDVYGGYSYLNSAAIAASDLIAHGAGKVAILDVDYHHGNGTQQIFYHRGDVLFASIHADPATDYPYFLGYADETGTGPGEGANLNLPLPRGTAWSDYRLALDTACDRIGAFGPDAVVVSLGVDTFEQDPISAFELTGADYLAMGQRIAGLDRPTLIVLEGGYAVAAMGTNVCQLLRGLS